MYSDRTTNYLSHFVIKILYIYRRKSKTRKNSRDFGEYNTPKVVRPQRLGKSKKKK